MHMLSILLVVAGFIAKLLTSLNTRTPEWVSWAFWLAAAVLWAIPQLSGV